MSKLYWKRVVWGFIGTPTAATAVMSKLNSSIDSINLALAKLGSESAGIDQHIVVDQKGGGSAAFGVDATHGGRRRRGSSGEYHA